MRSCHSIKDAAVGVLFHIEKFSPLFEKSKVLLDDELLGDGNSAIKMTVSLHPVVVSNDLEAFVVQNFQLIREFQEHVLALRVRTTYKRSVILCQ